ncbi:MAG: GNAT family N-acetyltransferase [Oscillospiraceae bacterium]|jgi:GNAT superfamily N-acetyltransferase|nr:GNAT family N-acetyltransferase [Oscillospiraceae bacterium]
MQIRQAQSADLAELLELYAQLHDGASAEITDSAQDKWREILALAGYRVLVGTVDERIVSSCTVIVVPNMTHNQRPYAIVENVITHRDFRNNGYATQLLNAARDIAVSEHCYKISLMTGSKEESTLRFYRNAGYNQNGKTAFVQWLE